MHSNEEIQGKNIRKKSKKLFDFWEFRKNFGFRFSCGMFLGSWINFWAAWTLARHWYLLYLRLSRVFPGHRFGRSEITKSKLQKTQETQKTPWMQNTWAVTKEYFWRHGDHAKGIGTMPKAWRPCQRLGDHTAGMDTMPKAFKPCQRLGDHTACMDTMPKAWRPS